MHVELEFGWWCNRTVTIRHLVIGGTSFVDKLYSQSQTGWMQIGGACKYEPCLGRMRKHDANTSWDPSLLGRAVMHKHFQLTLDHPPATPSDYTMAYYDDATPTSLAHVHKAYFVCVHIPIATYKHCSSCLHKCTHAHTHTHSPNLQGSAKRWKKFTDSECPEKEKFPGEWKNKTSLQKLCMMRALRPDRMTYAVTWVETTCKWMYKEIAISLSYCYNLWVSSLVGQCRRVELLHTYNTYLVHSKYIFCVYRLYVEEKLGAKYVEKRTIPFEVSFKETGPATPVFFVLSPGVDPLKDVEALGKKLGFTMDNRNFHNVSLGQVVYMCAVEFPLFLKKALLPGSPLPCSHAGTVVREKALKISFTVWNCRTISCIFYSGYK